MDMKRACCATQFGRQFRRFPLFPLLCMYDLCSGGGGSQDVPASLPSPDGRLYMQCNSLARRQVSERGLRLWVSFLRRVDSCLLTIKLVIAHARRVHDNNLP
jgi:hypothetical protein